jgi:hypothetical protein
VRAGPRLASTTGIFTFAAMSLLAARPSRADVTAELVPAITVGWTDNATAAGPNLPKQADEFGTVSGAARAHYLGKKTEQGLGYRLSLTKYLHQYAPDTVSQDVSYSSIYNLSPRLDLTVDASGTRSKTSAFVLQDQSATTQLAIAGAYLDYLMGTIAQGLMYRPTPRRRYIEGFSVSRTRYLQSKDANMVTLQRPPDTTYANLHLRSEWERTRDTFSLDGSFTDSYADIPSQRDTVGNHRLFAQALLGYHRDFNDVWSSDVAAGGVMVLTTSLAGIIAPAGTVSVGYRRLFWFANASISQTAAPNIFLGNATLNDYANLNLALPLSRSELFVISGNAGYTYARFASQGTTEKAYDLFSAGVSLGWHSQTLPLWGSLDYTYSNQRGSVSNQGGIIPSRERNTVLATIGGSFMFGKGTPPIINGSVLPNMTRMLGGGGSSGGGSSSDAK